MSDALNELVELLALERVEENLFRGQSQDLGWGTVFGGQVLGQAISAAQQTVPVARPVHSMHAYFLRPGDVEAAIDYQVDRIRDGRSFTTRRVVASQHGRPIFNLSASFQIEEEGLSHQHDKPEVRGPGVLSERELALMLKDAIPARLRARAVLERPIEIRIVDPVNPWQPEVREPVKHVWMKTADAIVDDPSLHRLLLAYASDFQFRPPRCTLTVSRGRRRGSSSPALITRCTFIGPSASMIWLLYTIDSPSSSGARGLVRGQFFDAAGHLVASCVQEGLMRQRPATPKG